MSREGDLRVSSRTWRRRDQSEFLHYDKPASLLLSLSEKFLFHTGESIPLDKPGHTSRPKPLPVGNSMESLPECY